MLGRKETTLYFCRDLGVPVNFIRSDEDCYVFGGDATPLRAAVTRDHEELALALLALPQLPGQEVKQVLRKVSPNDIDML